jgi:hypothetical protein
MFDTSGRTEDGHSPGTYAPAVDTSVVRGWTASLVSPRSPSAQRPADTSPGDTAAPDPDGACASCGRPPAAALPDAIPEGREEALISHLRALEDLKSAIAADQARAALALDTARRRAEAAAGVPADQRGRGVGAEVALARRESPHQGSRLLGFARILVTDMPRTLRALQTGVLTEWRATLIVRETVCLSTGNRHAVDSELAADTGALDGVGTESLRNRARRIAYRLEPEAAVARARKAVGERYVGCRPAPDTMAYLTALLPAADAISAYSALSRHADAEIGQGGSHGRGRGQVMADALVERLTGSPAGTVRTEVQLVMTDRTLLQGDSEPAHLPGYGTVPAQVARDLVRGGGHERMEGSGNPADGAGRRGIHDNAALPVWLRRLYTAPETGRLVAMDSRARLFPPGLRRLIATRDATCRTPYCDAPIRHADHIVPWRITGTTDAEGGQGLCENCNYVKEAPGWSARPLPGPGHAIGYRTPTGHTYVSTAPPLPGSPPPRRTRAFTHSVVDYIVQHFAA